MGNLNDRVLGVIHGVMPAIGAGAAYKRMRCGFEDGGLNFAAKIIGNHGDEVTAVLGNSPGGLELLPSQAYGNGWLHVVNNGKILKHLPEKGDPYEEIYKIRNRWYGLIREDWLNPAGLVTSSFLATCKMLDRARKFHNQISDTYHSQSYAHYGAGLREPAWHRVIWALNNADQLTDVERLDIVADNRQGRLRVSLPANQSPPEKSARVVNINMLPPSDAGDGTVPLHSAEHQLISGKFKGIFRQTGYDHQGSYDNRAALHSTIYSLVRIASTMKWAS